MKPSRFSNVKDLALCPAESSQVPQDTATAGFVSQSKQMVLGDAFSCVRPASSIQNVQHAKTDTCGAPIFSSILALRTSGAPEKSAAYGRLGVCLGAGQEGSVSMQLSTDGELTGHVVKLYHREGSHGGVRGDLRRRKILVAAFEKVGLDGSLKMNPILDSGEDDGLGKAYSISSYVEGGVRYQDWPKDLKDEFFELMRDVLVAIGGEKGPWNVEEAHDAATQPWERWVAREVDVEGNWRYFEDVDEFLCIDPPAIIDRMALK